MIFLDFPEMKELQKEIDKDDLYEEEDDDSYGLEKEPHVTLLYGLHDAVDPWEVKDIVRSVEYGPIEATKVTAFENEKYDVLKFDIKCKELHKVNKLLQELPHTNKFKDYVPHATIAYLKPGTAKKYIKLFKSKKFNPLVKKGVYSMPDGDKISFRVETHE
jgi:2'-5' RNA ligase